jgi:urea transport system substrate-binding protein
MLDMKRTVAARPRACLAFSFAATYQAAAEDTIKIGILHSLSGTMAISETTLKDTMLFLIDEQNKKGGLLGKNLKRSSLTRLQIGRSSPKKRAS